MRLGLILGFGPGAALGIGRFAYALVLPAMQVALNLSYAQAGLLGSANTAGYFLGSIISHRVLYKSGYKRGYYGALLLQTLSLLLLASSAHFWFLMVLRFAQGMLGAFVFVGGAALLLASGGRARATGMYFSGVGLGIALSPLVLPLVSGWRSAWTLLGVLSLVLTVVSMLAWPYLSEPAPRSVGAEGSLKPIYLLLLSYGLYGAGYIGYMTFVTSGLPVAMAPFWVVLGVGALLTGVVWSGLIERVGGATALLLILLVLGVSSLYPLLQVAPWLSAFLFGVSFLGVITAITQVFSRLLPAGAWARAMGLSTAAFALGQALGPGLSGLAGEAFAGAAGALGLSSVLIACALLVSVYQLYVNRKRLR